MTISIVLDTETTGLLLPRTADLNQQPRIIELAFVRIVDGEIVDEYEQLIYPERDATAEITKITGITNEMLVGRPKFSEVLDVVKEKIAGADQLICHNAPFDRGMLETELERCGCTDFPWPKETVCTVQEHYHLKGRRLKLTELYQMTMDKALAQTHRALDDVKALAEICVKRGLA